MNNPSTPKPTITKSTHVATVVQEYMDNLLVDLFPDVAQDIEALQQEPELETLAPQERVVSELTVADDVEVDTETVQEAPLKVEAKTQVEVAPSLPVSEPVNPKVEHKPLDVQPQLSVKETPAVVPEVETSIDSQIIDKLAVKPEALRYPQAPQWAQEAFDVLLFDVCGLKLAVPMEALGKIIKVEHETNQLIGRPKWFIGAYIENEQHLYVVDTAQYIMPEKGFNLADDGFDYVIQLQRSKWSLACKKVHSTVKLQPDQVKWRSQQGKRQWLSGTVVDHMCALIHVDSLIDLLEAEAK
ncbi:MAG: chemotaxis protein CheW [Bermanella sp.]